MRQLTLEEGLKQSKARAFPGVKQQEEADQKALAAKTTLHDDRAMLKNVRQEEDSQKKVLLEREKENFTKIYALKCHNGWLKICDNSAMIVAKKMDGALGKSYGISPDNGYGTRAAYGVISIPPGYVGDFIERLARAGVNLTFDDPWFLEFEYGERVSQEEMVRLLHEDELLIERVNQMVMPHAILPALRADVKAVLDFIHTQARNQKDSTKEVIMNDAERCAIRMNKMMIGTARGRVEIEECLAQLGEFTEEMYEYATTMEDMRLLAAKQYKEYVDLVYRTEMDLAREVKRMVVAKTEKEMKKSKKVKKVSKGGK